MPSKAKNPGDPTSYSALSVLVVGDKPLQDSLKQVLLRPHAQHFVDLLEHLLHPSPPLRSPVSYVIMHPMFVSLRAKFITRELQGVSDLSLESSTPMASLLKELTAKGPCVCGKGPYDGSCPTCTTGLTNVVAELGVKPG